MPKRKPALVQVMALPALNTRCWAVLATGPHIRWHVVDFLRTRWMARLLMRELKVKGFHDGIAIVRVTFSEGEVWSKETEGWRIERRSHKRSK